MKKIFLPFITSFIASLLATLIVCLLFSYNIEKRLTNNESEKEASPNITETSPEDDENTSADTSFENIPSEAVLSGHVQEISYQLLNGSWSTTLVFDLDKPTIIPFENLDGDIIMDQSFTSIQISVDNYTPDMEGKHFVITSHNTPYEAHTQYHIKPIVMLDVKLSAVD